MDEKIKELIENKIIQECDNDTLREIISYIQMRIEDIDQQLEEEYYYSNLSTFETKEELKIENIIKKQIEDIETMQKQIEETFKNSITELHDNFYNFDYMDLHSTSFQVLLNGLNALDTLHITYKQLEEQKELLNNLILKYKKEKK